MHLFSQDLFSRVTIALGIISAVVSSLPPILRFVVELNAARKKLAASEDRKFASALESDELIVLGDYLESTLGRFTIQEYSTDPEIRNRVDAMFSRLTDFVGAEGSISENSTNGSSTWEGSSEPDVYRGPRPSATESAAASPLPEDDFSRIKRALEDGDIWDGLARLRRAVEVTLRRYAIARGFKDRHLKSAGQILRILSSQKQIPIQASELLDKSIRICNRGVHGFEVSLEDAHLAMHCAAQALGLIKD